MTNHILQHAPSQCACGASDFSLIFNPEIVKKEFALSIPYVVECTECEEQYSTIPF